MQPFRILCLDGGGIRGTYTAAFLSQIEEMNNKRFVDHFDLIVGTSTGGIIALAMGAEIPLKQILQFYKDDGSIIFPNGSWFQNLQFKLKHIFKPKHCSNSLYNSLYKVFHDMKVGTSKTRLAIPSYNCSSGKIRLFKTAHHERLKMDYKLPMIDVAMATSSAPTYFPAHKFEDGLTCIDGGIWANCPVLVGIIEALTLLEKNVEELMVLSIGTTQSKIHIDKKLRVGGAVNWCNPLSKKYILKYVMGAQEEGALSQAELLLRDNFLRVNELTKCELSLDDSRNIDELIQLGRESARHAESEITEKFFQIECDNFIPIYT